MPRVAYASVQVKLKSPQQIVNDLNPLRGDVGARQAWGMRRHPVRQSDRG
jgi:hypothetical protein